MQLSKRVGSNIAIVNNTRSLAQDREEVNSGKGVRAADDAMGFNFVSRIMADTTTSDKQELLVVG